MEKDKLIKSIRYLDIENKIALGICKAFDFKTKKHLFSDLGIDDASPAASERTNAPNGSIPDCHTSAGDDSQGEYNGYK